jgi:hypothetical protein
MKGFYIYCIRQGAKKIKAKGVEFGRDIGAIAFRDIEAVVSEVDLSKFNAKTINPVRNFHSKRNKNYKEIGRSSLVKTKDWDVIISNGIKDKFQEDVKWAEKNIKRHHKVIVEANEAGAVIPMKFGTFYKTKKGLEAMLKKYYRKFKNLLSRLKDKQEWGVKGYLEYKRFADLLKTKNKKIKELEKKRASVPEGVKWYVDRKGDELIAGQIEYEVEEELKRIVDKLEKQAEEIRVNDPLPKELSEPGKDMVLNVACLVRNDTFKKFKVIFQKLEKECVASGITLTMSGPWPPYNFVEINEKAQDIPK